jgi:hypothetical protein
LSFETRIKAIDSVLSELQVQKVLGSKGMIILGNRRSTTLLETAVKGQFWLDF